MKVTAFQFILLFLLVSRLSLGSGFGLECIVGLEALSNRIAQISKAIAGLTYKGPDGEQYRVELVPRQKTPSELELEILSPNRKTVGTGLVHILDDGDEIFVEYIQLVPSAAGVTPVLARRVFTAVPWGTRLRCELEHPKSNRALEKLLAKFPEFADLHPEVESPDLKEKLKVMSEKITALVRSSASDRRSVPGLALFERSGWVGPKITIELRRQPKLTGRPVDFIFYVDVVKPLSD